MIQNECVASVYALMDHPSLPFTSLEYDLLERDRMKHGVLYSAVQLNSVVRL
jgi:hypothetical protein